MEWESFLAIEYTASVGASRMYFRDASDDYETLDWELELDYAIDDLTMALRSMGLPVITRIGRREMRRDFESIRLYWVRTRSVSRPRWSGVWK